MAHAAAGHVERGESVFDAAVRECAEDSESRSIPRISGR
ncbi:NUDIX domain-containing protein [Rhodococcus gordoniae]|nr:NUDIX domain-containing protein [Rhodococcus gordoniae]